VFCINDVNQLKPEAANCRVSHDRKRNGLLLERKSETEASHKLFCPNYNSNGMEAISGNNSIKCSGTLYELWRNTSIPI
jgi:hypothetical protein